LTDVAHPKHQEVRRRYAFRCGYCGVTEVEAGGELTVDHFHPVSAGGDDSDDNLVYACPRCNLHKSDFLPMPNPSHPERRLLHPLRDDVTKHIRENKETGFLEPLTETGRFHLARLRLNRPPLVEHRRQLELQALAKAKEKVVASRMSQLEGRITVQESYIADLERKLRSQRLSRPEDQP
jgi:hypothetical protein